MNPCGNVWAGVTSDKLWSKITPLKDITFFMDGWVWATVTDKTKDKKIPSGRDCQHFRMVDNVSLEDLFIFQLTNLIIWAARVLIFSIKTLQYVFNGLHCSACLCSGCSVMQQSGCETWELYSFARMAQSKNPELHQSDYPMLWVCSRNCCRCIPLT